MGVDRKHIGTLDVSLHPPHLKAPVHFFCGQPIGIVPHRRTAMEDDGDENDLGLCRQSLRPREELDDQRVVVVIEG